MKPRLLFLILMIFVPGMSSAQLALRFGKVPGEKGWDDPATLSYQHNDGGDSSYATQGTLAYTFLKLSMKNDEKAGEQARYAKNLSSSVRVSWAKNSLKNQEQDNHGAAFSATLDVVELNPQNFFQFDLSAGIDRDELGNSDALTTLLSVLIGRDELISRKNLNPVAFALFPSIGIFAKDTREAKADPQTGIEPTGTLGGYYVGAALTVIPSFLESIAGNSTNELLRPLRWSIQASTQFMEVTDAPAGRETGEHRLHSFALNYFFVDPPRLKNDPAPKLIPSLSLRRQIGSDPLNDVPKGGFTQLTFTLKY